MNKVQQLINEANENLYNNEYNSRTFKGIKNLSHSDIETIIMYAENFLEVGHINDFVAPSDNIKPILEKYGIVHNKIGW